MLYESSRAVSTASTREAITETIIQRIVSTNADCCEILLFEQHDQGDRARPRENGGGVHDPTHRS